MKKTNKVFIFFICIIIVFFGILWRVVQTESFANIVSNKLEEKIKNKTNLEVSFEKIEIELFPPTTILKNVILRDLKKKEVVLEAGKIGAKFGFLDLISKNFSIGSIFIENASAYFKLQFINSKDKAKNIKPNELFSFYQKFFLEKIPFKIKGLDLYNIKFITNYGRTFVRSLKLGLYPNIVTAEGRLESPEFLARIHEGVPDVDQISFDIEVTKEDLRIKSLSVYNKLDTVDFKGQVLLKDNLFLNISYFFKGGLGFLTKNLKSRLHLDRIDGLINGKGGFKGTLNNLTGTAEIDGFEVESEYVLLDDFDLSLKLENSILNLLKFKISKNSGNLELLESIPIYDFSNEKIIIKKARVKLKKYHSNDLLYFLGDKLNVMNLRASGEIDISFLEKGIILNPHGTLVFEQFELLNKKNNSRILSNELIESRGKSKIEISYDGLTKLEMPLYFRNSYVYAIGEIGNGGLNVTVKDSFVNMEEFGPISSVKILGKGKLDGRIYGPFDKVILDFDLDTEKFSILDINLGTIKGNFNLDLSDLKLKINDFKGIYKKTNYLVNGKLKFEGEDNIDLNFNFLKGRSHNIKEMIPKIVKDVNTYFGYFNFEFRSNFKLWGSFKDRGIGLVGKVNGSNITILGEDFDKFSTNFSFKKEKISINNFWLHKQQGSVGGRFSYEIGKGNFDYRFGIAGIKLKDFNSYRILNLGFDGEIYGEVYGDGKKENFWSRTQLKLGKGRINNRKLQDSILTVHNNGSDIFSTAQIFGESIKLDSYINLDKKKRKKLSYLNGSIDLSDLKVLFGTISKHNIIDEDLDGYMKSTFRSSFNLYEYEKLNLDLKLKKLFFKRKNVSLESKKTELIKIINGNIEKWNLNFSGDNMSISSNGWGNFQDKFNVDSSFNFGGELLELFSEKLLDVKGNIKGRLRLVESKNRSINYLEASTGNLTLRLRGVPGSFKDTKFKMILDKDRFIFKDFVSTYGDGKIRGEGGIKLKLPLPSINSNFEIERARISYLDKSNFVIGGNVQIKGDALPYNLSGNVDILHAEIQDEIKSLVSSTADGNSYKRYMPSTFLEGNLNPIEANVKIRIFKPILIKNSLAELNFKGSCTIFGPLGSPKFNGLFEVAGQKSKFLFKGHEFKLSEGKVNLIDTKRKESPELKFSGVAKINEYDVFVDISGRAEKMDIEMRSSPILSQEDILSLLTLGVTSDVSKNLGERERQSVTTLSIGTLIVDQLGINQNLNDSLGLRLQVSPDFEEDEESLLQGRTGGSSAISGKVKSSTKIQVKKRISEKVDLSVSSRIGGTIKNKQEMGFDIQLDKNFSIKGVYEVKSTDDVDDKDSTSYGIDFIHKFRF